MVETEISFERIVGNVYERLARTFRERTEKFVRGTRFRSEGRAPYLHLLYWLASSTDWSLSIRKAIRDHGELRGSISQIADKGYLAGLIESDPELAAVLHFDQRSQLLTVEDPQFLFYLRSTSWSKFAKDAGFLTINFPSRYDFALSFAGADRLVAEGLFSRLQAIELEVFYDKNEQHRILAGDVEEYLRPIYQSDAAFVVVLLGPEYPKRIWTKVESDAFKERLGDGDVIPIWFTTAPAGMFDETARVGGIHFDPNASVEPQLDKIAELLARKISDSRSE